MKGLPVGALIISAKKKDVDGFESDANLSGAGSAREQTSDDHHSSTGSERSEGDADRSAELKRSPFAEKDEEAVAGPLRCANSNGEWELRYYRIEKKKKRK